jgi:hypothetical protein
MEWNRFVSRNNFSVRLPNGMEPTSFTKGNIPPICGTNLFHESAESGETAPLNLVVKAKNNTSSSSLRILFLVKEKAQLTMGSAASRARAASTRQARGFGGEHTLRRARA